MEELYDGGNNAENNEENLSGNPSGEEKVKAPINKAALTAAILNLVSGAMFIAFSLLFFKGLTSFDSANIPEEQKLGLVIVFILFIPIVLITVVPSGFFGGIWGVARSVISFLQLRGERKSRLWVLILGVVLKVVVGAVAGFGLVLFASMDKSITPIIYYAEIVIGIIAILSSLAVIPFEFAARK